jgi:hypothetical protein
MTSPATRDGLALLALICFSNSATCFLVEPLEAFRDGVSVARRDLRLGLYSSPGCSLIPLLLQFDLQSLAICPDYSANRTIAKCAWEPVISIANTQHSGTNGLILARNGRATKRQPRCSSAQGGFRKTAAIIEETFCPTFLPPSPQHSRPPDKGPRSHDGHRAGSSRK